MACLCISEAKIEVYIVGATRFSMMDIVNRKLSLPKEITHDAKMVKASDHG